MRQRRPGKASSRDGSCSTNMARAMSSRPSANSNGNDAPRLARALPLACFSDSFFVRCFIVERNSTVSFFSRVTVPVLIAALPFAVNPAAFAQSAPAGADQLSEETWNSIKGDIFKDRPVLDGSGLVILDAPRRAEDSALGPNRMGGHFG